MKYCFFLLCILLSAHLYSQMTPIASKYDEDVCNCINQSKDANKLDCFGLVAMAQDSTLVLEAMQNSGIMDTTADGRNSFKRMLAQQSMIRMIDKCPAYYQLIDSDRYMGFKNLDKDSVLNEIKTLNQSDSTKRDDGFYETRAISYFALKQYDPAMSDADKGLSINPNNAECLLIKAWINELEDNFDEAAALYEQLANLDAIEGSNRTLFLIYKEIAEKKKADMNKNK